MRSGNARMLVYPAVGFTLMELLVVVVIIGVLVTMVVPSLGHGEGRNVSAEADRLVLLINHARQEAILSSQIWLVAFNMEEGSYEFRRRTGVEFETITRSPFSGKYLLQVPLRHLVINGEAAEESAQVTLYQTGEQESFSLTLGPVEMGRTVSMAPVGPASVETTP